jgi:predicted nucleic-acid-binding protein
MIAVDTNVLVRLLVADDAEQLARARELFDRQAHEPGSIWVSQTVLVELVWVLSRTYARPRAQVLAALRALASHATVCLEGTEEVNSAVVLYASGQADFADCLLAARSQAAGLDTLFTFDRKMRGLPKVQLL